MYKEQLQLRIDDFVFPYGTLDRENDWVRLAAIIPWDVVEARYAKQFVNNGHPAHPARRALGALLIKQRLRCSDEWTVKHVAENPYLQYFIGEKEYTGKCPFGASTMVEFRKRFSEDDIAARLEDTGRTVIAIALLCMNLCKRLRDLLRSFLQCAELRYITIYHLLFLFLPGLLSRPQLGEIMKKRKNDFYINVLLLSLFAVLSLAGLFFIVLSYSCTKNIPHKDELTTKCGVIEDIHETHADVLNTIFTGYIVRVSNQEFSLAGFVKHSGDSFSNAVKERESVVLLIDSNNNSIWEVYADDYCILAYAEVKACYEKNYSVGMIGGIAAVILGIALTDLYYFIEIRQQVLRLKKKAARQRTET